MNRVVEILMRREQVTEEEANQMLQDVREMLAECNYDPVESEDIISSELELEPDYIMDVLFD